MNIIIIGAGQVGSTLAENLVREDNNITVIDTDPKRLEELQDHLDIRTVCGRGSFPNVLEQAGAQDADMLIAVSSDDETNMVACQVAYSIFHTPTKIARIRSLRYLKHPELFGKNGLPIDFFISPEQIVTSYIKRLIEHPGALQVLDFANHHVQLVAIEPYKNGLLVGNTLSSLKHNLPNIETRVAAIFRDNRSIPISGSTVIQEGDEVFFIAAPKDIRNIMQALGRLDNPYRRIIIAGGGNIGLRLAESLENHYQVKIIEHNSRQTHHIANILNNTTVLHGDASDKELLINENIENTDVFCALTNDDEVNVMSAFQAKRLGARQVMALITRTAYVDLLEDGPIDIAISPQLATIGSILTHVRRGDIVTVHSLRRGAAEAIEAIAHGDRNTSQVVGRTIAEIALPVGASIGAIVRNDKTIIANSEVRIESGDHIVLFLADKKRIREVERLFQVDVTFL